MNWKRGLKRVWLIAAVGWLCYAFILFDVAYKIGYAWRYNTEYKTLLTEIRTDENIRNCEYISGNRSESYLDLIAQQKTEKEKAVAKRKTEDREHKTEELERQKKAFEYARQQLPMAYSNADASVLIDQYLNSHPSYEEQTKRLNADLNLPQHEAGSAVENTVENANIMRAKVVYDNCRNSIPSKPDYFWLLPMILVPTFGVAAGVIFLKAGFNLIRWIWLGFKP